MDKTFADVTALFRKWSDAMAMMASGAEPCRDCGTEGGYARQGDDAPRRTRGLCDQCYKRNYYRDTHTRYAYTDWHIAHPAPLPARVALDAPLVVKPWGAPTKAEWQAAVAWEERPDRWGTAVWVRDDAA